MATLFTKIINREIPADIVMETNNLIVIKDINPLAPIHLLVIPKKEIPTLNDISKEDKDLISDIFLSIVEIAKKLNISQDGYRIIANCNEFGGQEVFHLHFHLLAGEKIGPMRK